MLKRHEVEILLKLWGPNWGPTCLFLVAKIGVKRCRINVRVKINSRMLGGSAYRGHIARKLQ